MSMTGPPIPPIDYTSRDYGSIVQDLMAAISARLPTWTSRDPSDIGIVLLQLWAYVGDLLNFYIDRAANESFMSTATQRASVLKLASLIDYQPTGNVASTATMSFTIQTGLSSPVTIPAGTQVSTQSVGGLPPVKFETNSDLTIYGSHMPLNTQYGSGSGLVNQTLNLIYAFDGVSNTLTVGGTTWYNTVAATVTGTPTSSSFQVTVPGGFGIPTNGTASIAITINSAVVTFTYTSSDVATGTCTLSGVTPNPVASGVLSGQSVTFTLNSLSNVGAVNEYYIANGVVNFGSGTPNGNIPAAGVNNIVLTYTSPATYVGLVRATQGQTISNESVAVSNGVGNQQYSLIQSPVIDGSVQVFVDEGLGSLPWNYFVHLGDATSLDRAFTTATDENSVVTVIFGDGTNGRIPAVGGSITSTYRIGGGLVGNVGANTVTVLSSAVTGVTSVTNPSLAYGGADPETLEQIRLNAPKSLRTLNRAVTLDDYATLAVQGMGGGRASASAGVYTAVSLYINPPQGFFTDMTALQTQVNSYGLQLTNNANTGYLDSKKMPNAQVTVLPPFNADTSAIGYVSVDLIIVVHAEPNFVNSAVQESVISAISNTGQTGLLDFPAVDFGMVVTISSFYHTLFRVPGVNYLSITQMNRHTTGTPPAPGDVVCNSYEIPQLGSLTVTVSGGIPG